MNKDAEEVMKKVSDFETTHGSQLSEFKKNYQMFRCRPTKSRYDNQSNTFIPEMFVETEALATAIYEMLFSDNADSLFFDVTGQDGSEEDWAKAMVTKAFIAKQIEMNSLAGKVMPFLRFLILNGTQPVSVPWRLDYKTYWDNIDRVRRPAFDCWDFEPFKIVNFAFDDSHAELERCSWGARTEHVNKRAALAMAKSGVWERAAVDDALRGGTKRNPYDLSQYQAAGYIDRGSSGEGLSAITYFGTLESKDDNEPYYFVISKTGEVLLPAEINPYAHGDSEFLWCKWFTLPEEAYGMGIGHINYRQQSEINDRRNFINDLLYQSLYCMWLKRTDSGIRLPSGNKMRWSPHSVLTGDGISDEHFRPLRPDLNGLPMAVNIENADIERMRRHSGATNTLQAIATGVTATEASSVQSEAVRRVKVMLRAEVATFFRKMLYRVHSLNLQFADRDLVIRLSNGDGLELFGPASRQDQLINPDIRMKISTDLDFRPFKRRELIDLLRAFAELEKMGMMTRRRIIPDPVVRELAATYGMDPRKFFTREGILEAETRRATMNPAVIQQAMSQMRAESPAASRVMQTQMPVPAGAL